MEGDLTVIRPVPNRRFVDHEGIDAGGIWGHEGESFELHVVAAFFDEVLFVLGYIALPALN